MAGRRFAPKGGESPESVSIRTMRLAVGWLGMALPFVMLAGGLALSFGVWPLDSISDYYHTPLRDVFVGLLCAVAFFLFAYKGYDVSDFVALRVASAFALGIALFPTAADRVLDFMEVVVRPEWVKYVHYGSAIGFFLDLAYISFYEFTKTGDKTPGRIKLRKNAWFKFLAVVIVAAVDGILVCVLWPGGVPFAAARPVFWLETAALLAFGASWLVKGELVRREELAA